MRYKGLKIKIEDAEGDNVLFKGITNKPDETFDLLKLKFCGSGRKRK